MLGERNLGDKKPMIGSTNLDTKKRLIKIY